MSTFKDVLKQHYPGFRRTYTPSFQQARVALNITHCKTRTFGGRIQKCAECDHTLISYNSCRNRHCPMCQGVSSAVWADKRSRDVVNAPYFHLVFTIPQELHTLVYQNQTKLYALLYKVIAETLTELCADPKYLGAQAGFICVLHTWSQDLHYHPHIHTLLLAGGLTELNKWRSASKKFFIPVKVLSKKIRGKYLAHLKEYYSCGELNFFGKAEEHESRKSFQSLIDCCYAKDWYTYTKPTFTGPQAVLKYLGNYTRRIAIANSRIVSVSTDSVSFTVKDRKQTGKTKVLTLSGVEFIRRFLMHVLPKGFVKVRHYGVLATRNKTKLALCRKLTCTPKHESRFEGLSIIEVACLLAGRNLMLCPECRQGNLERVHSFHPALL
jgi:hypothetical protein